MARIFFSFFFIFVFDTKHSNYTWYNSPLIQYVLYHVLYAKVLYVLYPLRTLAPGDDNGDLKC
jgi:hypothetical protein